MAVGEFVSVSSQRDLELADLRTGHWSSRQVLQANSMSSPRSLDHVVSIVRWLDARPTSSVPEIRSGTRTPRTCRVVLLHRSMSRIGVRAHARRVVHQSVGQ